MRLMLAIFRKDVRQLWPRIAVLLVFLAGYGYLDAAHRLMHPAPVPALVVLLAVWYLIAGAIHAERPAGDRQYWITRPIPWGTVLAAKAAFIAAFFHLPLLAVQMISLAANGVSPLPHVPGLIGGQIWFGALAVIPVVALAAVTEGIVAFILSGLAGVAGCFFVATWLTGRVYEYQSGWGPVEWVQSVLGTALLLVPLAGMLVIEYRARRTWAARIWLAGAVLFSIVFEGFPLWHPAFAAGVQATGVRMLLDPARKPMGAGSLKMEAADGERAVAVAIPVRLEGVPAGMEAHPERTRVQIGSWESGWRSPGGLIPYGAGQWLVMNIDRDVFDRAKAAPVRLIARVAMTLLSPAAVTQLPIGARLRPVDGAGLCSATPAGRFTVSYAQRSGVMVSVWVECYAPVRGAYWGTTNLAAEDDRPRNLFAASAALGGLSAWGHGAAGGNLAPGEMVRIETRNVAARFEIGVEFDGVRLADYEAARTGGDR
jgi:hypothetical protein